MFQQTLTCSVSVTVQAERQVTQDLLDLENTLQVCFTSVFGLDLTIEQNTNVLNVDTVRSVTDGLKDIDQFTGTDTVVVTDIIEDLTDNVGSAPRVLNLNMLRVALSMTWMTLKINPHKYCQYFYLQ